MPRAAKAEQRHVLRFGGTLGGSKLFGAGVGVGAGRATTLAGMEGSEESGLDPEVVGMRGAGSVGRGAGMLEEVEPGREAVEGWVVTGVHTGA